MNGDENGGSLNELELFTKKYVSMITDKDRYLDNETGDIYLYKKLDSKWVPVGNIGLHHIKTIEKYSSKGKFLKKVREYDLKSKERLLFKSSMYETITRIKKQYQQHWAFQNLPNEFLTYNSSYWDIHPVNISNIEFTNNNYGIIAESDRGPEVFFIKVALHENCLCLNFIISQKYHESGIILTNYAIQAITDIYHGSIKSFSIEAGLTLVKTASYNTTLNSKIVNSNRNVKIVNGITFKNPIPFTKEFLHSGITVSNRKGILVLENNAIDLLPKKIDFDPNKLYLFAQQLDKEHKKRSININQLDSIKLKKENSSGEEKLNIQKGKSSIFLKYQKDLKSTKYKNISENSELKMQINKNKEEQSNECYLGKKDNLISSSSNYEIKPNLFIRHTLHPDLKNENAELKETQSDIKMENQCSKSTQEKMRTTFISTYRPYSRYKEFMNIKNNIQNIETFKFKQFQKPMSCSKIATSERSQSQQKSSKDEEYTKISSKKFWAYFPISSEKYFIKNYVSLDPSEPPASHKFRVANRKHWIGPNFKF